jgi:hypothetical protein
MITTFNSRMRYQWSFNNELLIDGFNIYDIDNSNIEFLVNFDEIFKFKNFSGFFNISFYNFLYFFDFSLIFYIFKKFYNCFRMNLF